MTQVLYRKWRPMTFGEVIGQDHITKTLRNALSTGRVGHAYLFSGPRGTGKTTMARLLAKAVNCLAEELDERPCNSCRLCRAVNEGRLLDLIEIDAASNTGVDDVRDLRDKVGFSPNEGRFKVYIIDEVHMLSTAAHNALLKTLEEPPAHAIFVLATTEVHKIPSTVLSRCQRFEFRRIPLPLIVGRLKSLLAHEAVEADQNALELVARHATGSLRDAESLLDQLLSSGSAKIELEHAQVMLGTADSQAVGALVEAWIGGDISAGLAAIQRSAEAGADLTQYARQIVDYLRSILFYKVSNSIPVEVPENQHPVLISQADALKVETLISGLKRFSQAVAERSRGWQPQLPLELALIETIGGRAQAQVARRGDAPVISGADQQPDADRTVPPRDENVIREGTADALPAVTDVVQEREPAPVGAVPSLSDIREGWGQLLAAVKHRDYRVEAMLRSGQGALGLEGEVVALGFKYSLHREKMATVEWRTVVESALREVMGCALQIRCVDPKDYVFSEDEAGGGAAAPRGYSSEELDELVRFGTEDLSATVKRVDE